MGLVPALLADPDVAEVEVTLARAVSRAAEVAAAVVVVDAVVAAVVEVR